MKKTYEVKIFGRIQGVGFRWNAAVQAKKLKIAGFVRNESDGSVFLEAEGDEESLRKFLAWCRKGPFFAKVDQLDFREMERKDYKTFEVR